MILDRERLALNIPIALRLQGIDTDTRIGELTGDERLAVVRAVLGDIEAQGFVIIQRVEPSRIEELEAEIIRLRNALLEIMDLPGELNMGNYTHEDVSVLNDSHIAAFMIANEALGGNHE